MGISSTPTFEVKDGNDCVTVTNQHGDTTSDKVSRIKRERPDEWAALAPAYDAWKADKKVQAEARKADEAKAKDAPQTPAEPAPAPEENDDDDDDKNDKSLGRRTLAKGYRK